MNSIISSYLTPDELFRRVEAVIAALDEAPQTVNRLLHDTLVLTCAGGLRESRQAFGNLFSQVDFLCKRHRMAVRDVVAIQKMRRDSNRADLLSAEDVLYHCRALCLFISAVFSVDVPSVLVGRIPTLNKPAEKLRHIDYRYLRCIVRGWEGDVLLVEREGNNDGRETRVDCSPPEWAYLRRLTVEGMQLNLLDCTENQGLIVPQLVVVEPDFLVDISAIARCFTDYGHHPLAYTVNRMAPQVNSQAILIGGFAGAALDDVVNNKGVYDWRTTLVNTFKEHALAFCTCPDLNAKEPFKDVAIKQARNIGQIVDELFGGDEGIYAREKAILEPSFVCEALGLQGRVDLMTTDFRLLIEQKSGANYNILRNLSNAYGSFQKEDHYVQLLLYYGVLQHNFHLSNRQVDIRLLYSKYPLPGGLVVVSYLQRLFHEALHLRNRIVAQEFAFARRGFKQTLPLLSPETLNEKALDTPFFHRYLYPQIDVVTRPLHRLSPLEEAYFCRMMTFVYREQLLSKVGHIEGKGGCGADLWNMPLAEKRETGNIFTGLQLEKMTSSRAYNGFDLLTFSIPEQGEDFLPNFRRGDMVYLYACREGAEPDVRASILFKGVLADLSTDRLTVHLNDGLQNADILPQEALFVVEHSASDIGHTAAIKALHTFATAPQGRRALLLSQREPRWEASARLTRSYHPHYDEVLLKVKQAKDYFLLVGPPGTGKTSMALRFIVEEELASSATPSSSVLLLSYTHRAVDEMCEMLSSAGIPFIRIGSEYSCDPRFRSYLLENVVEETPRLEHIRQRIEQTQVFVATTSTLQSRPYIFALKRFSLAVVDEASQILEPNIIGLLCASAPFRNAKEGETDADGCARPAIERFVLIGDYKQLPAVVQQNGAQAAVQDPLLEAIGLTDCRLSLFQRLIRWEQQQGRTRFIGTLARQGRMHPEVAAFACERFYAEEGLDVVPCPHQKVTSLGYDLQAEDELDRLLQSHRLLFFASPDSRKPGLSDKANPAEACIVAHLLARIRRFYGDRFEAHRTVGVIVPYRNQIAMIRREVERLGLPELNEVTIDTVERYQGSQRDVVIYSFTVQNVYQLDFLTANCFEENDRTIDRKLNVALTRARTQMLLTGHAPTLSRNSLFAQLMAFAREKGGYVAHFPLAVEAECSGRA